MKLMTYPCKMGCICFLTSKLTIFIEVDTLFVIFFKNKISKQPGKNGPHLSDGGGPIDHIGIRLVDKCTCGITYRKSRHIYLYLYLAGV